MKKIILVLLFLYLFSFTVNAANNSVLGTTTGITNTPICPLNPVKKAPKGCYYKTSTNTNGCEVIGKLVCNTSTSITPTTPICPLNPVKKAPKGCYYKTSTNTNGCKINGKLVCKNPNPLPLTITDKKTSIITYGLSDYLIIKVNITVSKFILKLNKKYSSSTNKIYYLNKIILKLDKVSILNPKYNNLISYLTDKLKLEIVKYNNTNTNTGIDSIFKLLK